MNLHKANHAGFIHGVVAVTVAAIGAFWLGISVCCTMFEGLPVKHRHRCIDVVQRSKSLWLRRARADAGAVLRRQTESQIIRGDDRRSRTAFGHGRVRPYRIATPLGHANRNRCWNDRSTPTRRGDGPEEWIDGLRHRRRGLADPHRAALAPARSTPVPMRRRCRSGRA